MAEEALQKVAETVFKKKRPDKSEQNKVQDVNGYEEPSSVVVTLESDK